ncbi:MAG TPA: S1C family serine protease [Polyangiaceae bacterium]|jgi:S1-C subfamily serine protease|nr:S1C family serine protease [Polyangiaceae bacterium]
MSNVAVEFSRALSSAFEQAEGSVLRVDGGRRRSASGTVYSADGLVVTALHAIEREEGIEVFDGKESVGATLVGADPGTDLALLRAERPLGKPASFADEAEFARGQLALAISRPGRSARAALAVISALGGEWRGPRGSRVERYLQLSLPLEPGYSGGLVIDAQGRALGVGMAGILRATPLVLTRTTLERVASAIAQHGRVRRGYLGANFQPVRLPAALAEQSGQRAGLLIAGLEPGGPAEQAGVLLGDVVLEAGGARLSSLDELFAALEEERIDKPLALRLSRAGNDKTLDVVPRARP